MQTLVETKHGTEAGMRDWGFTWREANPMARAFPKHVQRLNNHDYECFLRGVEASDEQATR